MNSSDYPPDDGYDFIPTTKPRSAIMRMLNEVSPIIFDILKNLFIRKMAAMHHAHSRPSNYSNNIMEQRIRQQLIKDEYYQDEIIKPRLNKVFRLNENYKSGHRSSPTPKSTNAWVMSFQPPDDVKKSGLNKSEAYVCFSEKEAVQLAKNSHLLAIDSSPDIYYPYPDKLTNHKVKYSRNNYDPLFNVKLEKLERIRLNIINHLNARETIFAKVWKKINGSTYNPKSSISLHQFIKRNALLNAHVKKDPKLYQLEIEYLEIDAQLTERFVYNNGNKDRIEKRMNENNQFLNKIVNRTNPYLQKPLRNYILYVCTLLYKECELFNTSALAMQEILQKFLQDINNIDYTKIYLKLPKKSGLFDINFTQFKNIMNETLDRAGIEAYTKRLSFLHAPTDKEA